MPEGIPSSTCVVSCRAGLQSCLPGLAHWHLLLALPALHACPLPALCPGTGEDMQTGTSSSQAQRVTLSCGVSNLLPLQPPAPLKLCIEASVPWSPRGLPLFSPWATTVLWPQTRAGTRDLGHKVCKARYGSTLSNTDGMREGLGACPDDSCNGTPCLSAGFPSTALCFRVPALSGVYGLALSPGPICGVHHAGLMGSFCGTSLQ